MLRLLVAVFIIISVTSCSKVHPVVQLSPSAINEIAVGVDRKKIYSIFGPAFRIVTVPDGTRVHFYNFKYKLDPPKNHLIGVTNLMLTVYTAGAWEIMRDDHYTTKTKISITYDVNDKINSVNEYIYQG